LVLGLELLLVGLVLGLELLLVGLVLGLELLLLGLVLGLELLLLGLVLGLERLALVVALVALLAAGLTRRPARRRLRRWSDRGRGRRRRRLGGGRRRRHDRSCGRRRRFGTGDHVSTPGAGAEEEGREDEQVSHHLVPSRCERFSSSEHHSRFRACQ